MTNDPTASSDAPRQKSAIARDHLARIGRADGTIMFRAIMDDPERKNARGFPPVQLDGTFDQHAQPLRRLNDAGYGIFYQANLADGRGFKAGNIVGATTFFADFDGTPLGNVDRLGLPPHVTVETSPGKRHFYWRVNAIPIDAWTAIQKRLIALFGSDKSIHDTPRIMRLPGFLHMKQPEAPHLATIVATSDAPAYEYDAFVAALTAAEAASGIVPEASLKPLPKAIAPPIDRDVERELAVAESALRHSIAAGPLDLAERSEWIKVGIALKASCGEDGFPLWVQLSSEADGFEDEDDCRRNWNTFKSDRPTDKQLTIATFVQNAKYSGWKHPGGGGNGNGGGNGGNDGNGGGGDEPGEGGSDPAGGRGGKGKPDAATIIVEQAEEAGDEHFLSPEGQAYATYSAKRADGTARRVTTKLNSSEYAMVLLLRHHTEAVNKAAPREQINTAVNLMEARARAANVQHPVYLRFAHHAGRVYVNVDPDDGIVVEIDDTAEEWRFISNPPVRFITGSRGRMALPRRGGTRAMYANHFNTADDDLTRVIGFMLGTFLETEAYPIFITEGEAGAGKSSFNDKMIALTDPPRGSRKKARFSLATEERNLHVQAARCNVMMIDNAGAFTAEVADQFCRLSTGYSSSFRMHNTMDEEQQMGGARPLIVSCITTPSARTDLLSRAIRVTVLPAELRRTEAAVWRSFAEDEGAMIGFLFSCISTALRNRAAVTARGEAGDLLLPRMADFAVWVEAAAEKLGIERGAFAALLCSEQQVMQAAAARTDPIVDGLAALVAEGRALPITVSARGLRDLLAARNPGGEWPHHNQFQARLKRHAQGLRELGVEVKIRYDSHAKGYRFDIAAVAEGDRSGVAREPGKAAMAEVAPAAVEPKAATIRRRDIVDPDGGNEFPF